MTVVKPRSPFSDRCDPEEYIPRRATEDAIRSLRSLVREGEPAVVLRGPRGIGKSMLLRILDERLSYEHRVAYVSVSSSPEPELCHRVLEQLHEPSADDPAEALISAARLAEDGYRRLVLLIDHAERTPIASSLQLVRAATSASPHMTVIFAIRDGERADEFVQALETHFCGIQVTFDQVMNPDEAVEYFRRSLNRADVPEGLRSRIDPPTLAWIIQGAHGLPREINRRALELLDRYKRGEDSLIPEGSKQEAVERPSLDGPPVFEPRPRADAAPQTLPTRAGISPQPLRAPSSLGQMLVGHRDTPAYDLTVDLTSKQSLGFDMIKSPPPQSVANSMEAAVAPVDKPVGDPVAMPVGDPVEPPQTVPPDRVPRVETESEDPQDSSFTRSLLFAFSVGIVLGTAVVTAYLAGQIQP